MLLHSLTQKIFTYRLCNKDTLILLTVCALSLLTGCSQQITQPGVADLDTITSSDNTTSYSDIEELLTAEFILQRKDPKEAFEPFYKLARKSKNTTLVKRLVNIAVTTQNDAYVEKSANLWLATEPTSEAAYSLKFQVLIKSQRLEETVTFLTHASQNNVSLRFLPIYLEDNLHNNERLKAIANIISKLSPEIRSDQYIQLSHAHLLLLSGQYQAAIETSKQLFAQKNIEKSEALYLILAFSQKGLNTLKEAINTLTTATRVFPNNTKILTPLISFLIENKEITKASSVYSEATFNTHEKLQLSVNFMRVLLEYQYPQKAIEIAHALPKETFNASNQIQYLTATALYQLNKKAEATAVMNQVDGNLRNNATHKIAIWLYDEQREKDINDMVLRRTLRENMPEQVSLISLLHEEKGNINLSYDLISRAANTLPESDILRYKKALLAETLGNWKITEIELKKLLQKDPENPQYLNALGYTLLTRTKRIDEAMRYIESAYEKDDNNPAIIDSLGWGHFMKGEFEQASYFLKKAWSILPDAEIAAHYGESLWKQHYYAEAIKIWQTALNTSPNAPLLLDTIKRLSPSLLEKK